MKDLWTVIRLELLLFRRGRTYWLIGPLLIFGGILTAGIESTEPWRMWLNEAFLCLLITLILGVTTVNQLQRDNERHIDGVLMSTPVTTNAYVWGKYLAGLLILVGFACLEVLTAMVTDHLVNRGTYGSLGPWPYLATWGWLTLMTLVFVAALPLFLMTLTRGQRAISYVALLVIWLLPLFLQNVPQVLVVWGGMDEIPTDPAFQVGAHHINDSSIAPALAQQIIHLVQTTIPQADITPTFLWNRLLFISLAVLLVMGTAFSLQRQRQGF
ncbi:MAG: ABC transporter permease [Chloroflexota bacterium]|nr:ABC transporter permease [Chloroflexota bacterium]